MNAPLRDAPGDLFLPEQLRAAWGRHDRTRPRMSGLTELQCTVARAFFSLDSSLDFVLTGGVALLAHDLITRATGALDLFSTTAQRW